MSEEQRSQPVTLVMQPAIHAGVAAHRVLGLLPGVAAAAGIAFLAKLIVWPQASLLGHDYIDPIPLALVLGLGIAAIVAVPSAAQSGISFSSKTLIEAGVGLIGLTLSFHTLAKIPSSLLFAIIGTVILTMATAIVIGRLVHVDRVLSLLIGCGTAICGNSAIASVARVVDAPRDQVALAVTFTALLGVAQVIAMPIILPALGMGDLTYGLVVGMSVYAVPQVAAASFQVSTAAGEVATIVKLVRVIMIGPVSTALSILLSRKTRQSQVTTRPALWPMKMIPWFIWMFVACMVLSSTGLVDKHWVSVAREVSTTFLLVGMAGIGLGFSIKDINKSSLQAVLCVSLTLAVLISTALLVAFTIDVPEIGR